MHSRSRDDGGFAEVGNGSSLHWPELDLDVYVPNLIKNIYGTKKWMSALGRRGGMVRSAAKCRSSRKNGAKGGRPRKNEESSSLISASTPLKSSGRITEYSNFRYRYTTADFATAFRLPADAPIQALPRLA